MASQWTTFHEHRCPDTWSVMNAESLDIENESLGVFMSNWHRF